MGPAGVKGEEGLDEEINIVALAGHEVATAKVNPLEMGKPRGEFIYNMFERAREGFGTALAMAMDVETLDGRWEIGGRGEVGSKDTEAGAGGAGVVELGLNLAVFGIDTEAYRGGSTPLSNKGEKTVELGEGIEGDV